MLESLFYICAGPGLVIVALIVVRQIGALRDQTEQSEKHHRRVLALEGERRAVDLADKYHVDVLPAVRRIASPLMQLRAGEWGDALSAEPTFEWESVIEDAHDRVRLGIQLLSAVNLDEATIVLDRLESIALQFNRGVATDTLGRSLLQTSLLDSIRQLSPIVAWLRIDSANSYVELIALYNRWTAASGSDSGSGHH